MILAMQLLSDFLGWSGALFVLYGAVSGYTGETWKPVENWAPLLSSLLTLAGTVVTACSVYTDAVTVRPAWSISTRLVVPIVVVAALVAIVQLARLGELPSVVVNGFALLAISGGLKRMVPYPDPLAKPAAN